MSSPPDAVVRVRVADAAAIAGALGPAAPSWMTPADRARFDRFRHDADRRMFVAGRVMSRAMVARALGVEPGAWTWREGPRGRPEIVNPATHLRFNVSHSGGCVVCATADGRDVGVDVECVDRRRPDAAIVDRYCSSAEAADVRGHGDAWFDRFLTYWTLKESYLKARGLGIGVPLADISLDVTGPTPRIGFERSLSGTDDRWAFHVWQPTPRHLAAVAAFVGAGPAPRFEIEAFA